MSAPRIVIVGAGPAGLACARALLRGGVTPLILEKSRGIGGRVATRRTDGLQFDHGTPALARGADPALAALLDEACATGRAAPWPGLPGAWVGTPGMTDLLRPLAEGQDIAFSTEVTALHRDGDRWRIAAAGPDGPVERHADRVVLAIPAPQALRLVPETETALRAALAGVAFAPCYTLMIAFADRPGWPEHMHPGPPFDLVLRDASKPGRPGAETWVAHADADWSAAHLERERPDAAAALQDALAATLGPLPPVIRAIGHRWRHARATAPLGAPCAVSHGGALLAGGDWATGRDVTCALASGAAMATRLMAN